MTLFHGLIMYTMPQVKVVKINEMETMEYAQYGIRH